MATVTKRRARRAAKRLERHTRALIAARSTLQPPRGYPGSFDPPPRGEDPEGNAGVREPRRPIPGAPAGAMALDLPEPDYLQPAR